MRFFRRHGRRAARVVREAAGFDRPGQQFRVWPNDPADVRPFAERLAEQRRIAAIGAVVWAEHQGGMP